MSEQRVIYDDFSKGEFGHTGAQHAPDGSFTGRNVMVYRNGLIGPRPGIKASNISPSAGVDINNMWWAQGASGTDLFWIDETGAVKKANATTGAITACGSITAPAAGKVAQAVDAGLGVYYVTVQGDKTYKIDLSAATTTALVGVIGGIDLAIVGDRLFVANNGTDYFNVYYSNAADFDTWTSTDFFQVGKKAGIAGLSNQRDHLAILMQDGSWYVYRGVGSSAVLRRVTPGGVYPWVLNPHAKALLGDDLILYMTPNGDWPLAFDGANVIQYPQAGPEGDVQPYSDVTGVRVLPARRPGESLIVVPDASDGALGYLGRDGAWSLHTLPTSISEVAGSSHQGVFALSNKTSPTLYMWDLRIDRPAFTSDDYARPGDLSDTPLNAYFYLPEFWSPPGTEVLVKQVVVDFVKYTTGATGDDNAFTLSLTTFGGYDNPGTESPTAQSFTENGAASTSGVKDRKVFNVGDQGWGPGFQAGLTGIKGVAVKSVTVVIETQAAVPRV